MLMLHEPSAVVSGTADDLLSMAAALEKMRAGLIAAYRDKSGLNEERIAELLAGETWLSADEALELGFADRIEAPVNMAARFDLSAFTNAPAQLEAMFTQPKENPMSEDAKGLPAAAEERDATGKETTTTPFDDETQRDTGAEIVDLDAVRAAERKATLAYVTEINELCALAGKGDLAADFIARAVPAEQVRKSLLEARAAEDEATAVRSLKSGEARALSEPVIDTAAIYAARNKLNDGEGH